MPAAPPAWRLLSDLDPSDGPTHMALDTALLESVRAGAAPVLRLYRWAPPTLSFGRNQPARELYDEAAARASGIAFVRRPTGGQAVLHDDELTYAVVAPVAVVGRPRAAYQRINAALAAGLRGLGLAAAVAEPAGRTAVGSGTSPSGGVAIEGGRDWAEACFARPAPGEVVVAGRKLVGSAQRCESRVILQHGSILVGGSQAAAEELLRRERQRRPAGWTTIGAELGARPSWAALAAAVVDGFEETLGISLAPDAVSAADVESARRLRERYTSRMWTWRR